MEVSLSYKRQFHQAITDLVQANAVYTLAFLVEQAKDIHVTCYDGGKRCSDCDGRHACRLFLLTYVPRDRTRIIE